MKRRLGINEPTISLGSTTLYEEGDGADDRLRINLEKLLKVHTYTPQQSGGRVGLGFPNDVVSVFLCVNPTFCLCFQYGVSFFLALRNLSALTLSLCASLSLCVFFCVNPTFCFCLQFGVSFFFFLAFLQDLPGGGIKNDTSVEVEDFSQDLTVKLSVFHKTFDEEEVSYVFICFYVCIKRRPMFRWGTSGREEGPFCVNTD